MIGPSAILKMFGFAGREPVDISGTELIGTAVELHF